MSTFDLVMSAVMCLAFFVGGVLVTFGLVEPPRAIVGLAFVWLAVALAESAAAEREKGEGE